MIHCRLNSDWQRYRCVLFMDMKLLVSARQLCSVNWVSPEISSGAFHFTGISNIKSCQVYWFKRNVDIIFLHKTMITGFLFNFASGKRDKLFPQTNKKLCDMFLYVLCLWWITIWWTYHAIWSYDMVSISTLLPSWRFNTQRTCSAKVKCM